MRTTDSDRASITAPPRREIRFAQPAHSGPTRTIDAKPTARVQDALRTLPSHGWPVGWVGRRDRALLVLAELVGLNFEQIASLAAGDVVIADGTATISTPGGRTALRGVDDDLLCGPCALARWVHALDLTVVYPDGRVIAAVIARAVPLRSDSPHLCHSNNTITEVTRRMALLPPIDQWGHPIRAALPSPQPAAGRGPGARTSIGAASIGAASIRAAAHRAESNSADITQRAAGLELRVGQLLERAPGTN